MSDLISLLDAVKDEQTFVEFLRALGEDSRLATDGISDGSNWQNDTIEQFLESAARWAIDSKKIDPKHYKMPDNPWQRAADIIYSGKITNNFSD